MAYQEFIEISTSGHRDMHDLTPALRQIVRASGVHTGTAHIFNVGSTAVIGTIEFESGLQGDFPDMLDRLIPPSTSYGHEQAWHDGNGHSHLQASLVGPELTVPIQNGVPVLGTWQQVFHLECDIRPRKREIVITVIGS
jgi:secondary thiamine-phosphate synthase enzyme